MRSCPSLVVLFDRDEVVAKREQPPGPEWIEAARQNAGNIRDADGELRDCGATP